MATRKTPVPPAKEPPREGGHDHDHDDPSSGDPVLQVRLVTDDVAAFKKLVETTPLEFACATPRMSPQGVVSAHVLMKRSVVERVGRENQRIKIEIVADPADITGERRPEVGAGNRFAERRTLPQGRGKLIPRAPQ